MVTNSAALEKFKSLIPVWWNVTPELQ